MVIDILLPSLGLIFGIACLYFGGDWLVNGSVTIANRLKIAPLWVGLSVVAFGTSAPELFVNVRAAIEGHGAISFGNIFGSNIANIALILALCAIRRPLDVHKQLVRKTIPMLLAFTGLAIFMALDPVREPHVEPGFTRMDGVILLALFGCFLSLLFRSSRSKKIVGGGETGKAEAGKKALLPGQAEEIYGFAGNYSVRKALLIVLGSVAGLAFGGWLTVLGAVKLAETAGIPEEVIGLVIIAFGTSLPELVVGLIATSKGHVDLAVGNVVGSNIFNLLLIMGVTSTIGFVPLPEGGREDLILVGWIAVLLYLTALTQKRISKTEGWIFLVIYLAYMIWRFSASVATV